MKTLKHLIYVLAVAMMMTSVAMAAATKKKKLKSPPPGMAVKPAVQTGAKLSTSMDFDELNVHGRYQSGDEGNATVEDEKVLKDLLDYRRDYKDRLKNSRAQR